MPKRENRPPNFKYPIAGFMQADPLFVDLRQTRSDRPDDDDHDDEGASKAVEPSRTDRPDRDPPGGGLRGGGKVLGGAEAVFSPSTFTGKNPLPICLKAVSVLLKYNQWGIYWQYKYPGNTRGAP